MAPDRLDDAEPILGGKNLSPEDGDDDDWDVPDSRIPVHGNYPIPFVAAGFNRLLVTLQRPAARAALKKRRQRLLAIRRAMEERWISGAEAARHLRKSPSQINAILRGHFPWRDAWQMPRYFEQWAVDWKLTPPRSEGDGLDAPPLEAYVAEAQRIWRQHGHKSETEE